MKHVTSDDERQTEKSEGADVGSAEKFHEWL
jgi:hypothetical protein